CVEQQCDADDAGWDDPTTALRGGGSAAGVGQESGNGRGHRDPDGEQFERSRILDRASGGVASRWCRDASDQHADADEHAEADQHADGDSYADKYAHRHADCDKYADSHADRDDDTYEYAYAHRDAEGH